MENIEHLVRDIIETLTASGSFEAFECAPEESNLPFVYDKLLRILKASQETNQTGADSLRVH